MTRAGRKAKLAALAVLLLGILGNRPACDNRPPNLGCDTDIPVTVLAGTCVSIDNPCEASGNWTRVDGLRLCDEPARVFVQARRSRSGTTREICAAAHVGILVDEPVPFVYVRPGDLGEGQFLVTTGTPIGAVASATPSTIDPGQSSHLDVRVTGGSGDYDYSWSPATGLNSTVIADPVAMPQFTTTYTVSVLDNVSLQTGNAQITLVVTTALDVSATPGTIAPGGTVALAADFVGGAVPIVYGWAGPVDDPASRTPTSDPLHFNTLFQVTAADSQGHVAIAQVEVLVQVDVIASATPATLTPPAASQLSASVLGGTGSYTFSWTPNTGLDDDSVFDPILDSSALAPAVHSYTVTVTDDHPTNPQSDVDTVDVTVGPAGGCPPPTGALNAVFTPGGGGPFPPSQPLDATCSEGGPDGPVVEYCWWMNWTNAPGQDLFPDFCNTTGSAFLVPGETGTSRDVRLRVEDQLGARGDVIHTFVF